MGVKLLSTIFFMGVLCPASSFSAEPTKISCNDRFALVELKGLWSAGVPSYFRKTYLSEGDIKKIEGIFLDLNLSPREKMQKAYQTYVNARVKDFSPAQKKEIFAQIRNLIKKSEDGRIEASAAKISMPEDLRFTATSYSTIVHEVEHKINSSALRESDQKTVWKYVFKFFFTPKPRFVDEESAMKAEWELLHNIPKEYRLHGSEALSKVGLSKQDERFYRDMIETADLPLEDYLHHQHKIGRYGYFWSLKNTANNYAIASPFVVLPIALTIGGYQWACGKCEAAQGEFSKNACQISCAEPR